MLRVEEVNGLAELQPRWLRWRKLLGETRGGTFFQSPTWLQAYWQAFGHACRLRVLIVHAGNEVLGIVPLVVSNRRSRLGNCRVLSYPVLGCGMLFGPIGPNPTACLLSTLRHLQQTPRDWDVLDLATIDPTMDCGRTEHALHRSGLPARQSDAGSVAATRFESDWQTYWSGRSVHCRTSVHRAESRLAAAGNVQYVHYRPGGTATGDDEPRWDLYDACVAIVSKAATEVTAATSPLTQPITGPFFRNLHALAVEAGAIDLHLLMVDGLPVAFSYGYWTAGHAVALECGWRSERAFKGAPTVLMSRLLERCCSLGDRRFTFAASSLRWARRWLTDLAPGERYTYYARTPRMQLLRFTRSLVGLG